MGDGAPGAILFRDNTAVATSYVDSAGNATNTVLSLSGLPSVSVFTDIVGLAPSPDGTKLAVSARNGPADPFTIEVYNIDGSGAATVLVDIPSFTNPLAAPQNFAWSPDGTNLAYVADPGGQGRSRVYVVATDGMSEPELVSQDPRRFHVECDVRLAVVGGERACRVPR